MVSQIRSHKAFPQLAMIGRREVEQFVDDDVVPDVGVEAQQLPVEIQVAIGRTRGPFVCYWLYNKPPCVRVVIASIDSPQPLLEGARRATGNNGCGGDSNHGIYLS